MEKLASGSSALGAAIGGDLQWRGHYGKPAECQSHSMLQGIVQV